MTRAADAALDMGQLKLGEQCERMLASRAWNLAHTSTQAGLIQRLEMITEAGLPPMRLVPNETLATLGRIPRSHEGHQVDALEAVRKCGAEVLLNRPLAVILFYSHRWARPNWCEKLGKDQAWGSAEREAAMREGHFFGDPDDAEHSKAKDLIEYAKWFKRLQESDITSDITSDSDLQIYWWIDWACTNQDSPGPDMAALPAYAAVSAGIVAAWTDVYKDRAWCQVELLMAYAFMTSGKSVFVVPAGFTDGAHTLDASTEEVVVADPVQGKLTNDGDRALIESLTGVARRSIAFSCWRSFVKQSTESVLSCCFMNVCLCCQCCGIIPIVDARSVVPGKSKVKKVVPQPLAPTNQQMQQL